MHLEDSPTLDLYKDGLPDHLPDPSRKKKIIRIVIIGMMVLSLVLAFFNMAQNGTLATLAGTGNAMGMVYDDQGHAIAANVFVFGADVSAQSDQTGRFELKGIPSGQQVVIVSYRNVGREYTVNITAGQTVNMGEVRFQKDDFLNGWSQ